MSAAASQLHVRRATHLDYSRVIDMMNPFEGLDYMPHFYHVLLNTKEGIPFVAEKDGKVVGFAMDIPVLSGKAWLGVGGRVHPDYQRQGVAKSLQWYKEAERRKLYPGDVTKPYYYIQAVPSEGLENMVQTDTTVLVSQMIIGAGYGCNLKKALASTSIPPLVSSHYCNTVELTPSNWHQFQLSSCLPSLFFARYLVSVCENSKADIYSIIATSTTFVTTNKNGEVTGVSFSNPSLTSRGFFMRCYFYGNDADVMLAHVLKQCQILSRTSSSGNIFFRLCFPMSVPKKEMVEFLQNHLLFNLKESVYSNRFLRLSKIGSHHSSGAKL